MGGIKAQTLQPRQCAAKEVEKRAVANRLLFFSAFFEPNSEWAHWNALY